jgi:hypothetical protein
VTLSYVNNYATLSYATLSEDATLQLFVLPFLQILMLNSAEDLNEYIDKDQLTVDLGGHLAYDHREWIQHRAVMLVSYFGLVRRVGLVVKTPA